MPRIAFRESDGLWLASYQTGSSALQMFVKASTKVHDWRAPAPDFAVSGNNHDSLPVVMPDGAFVLFWVLDSGGPFAIAARRSLDGMLWGPTLTVTATPGENLASPIRLDDAWRSPCQRMRHDVIPPGSNDYDIVRDPAVVVLDPVCTNGFEHDAILATVDSNSFA